MIRTAAGDEITSSYERGDTVRSLVRNLRRGVQESVKLIGKGGKINAWMPSSAAYGAEGDKELGVAPNATLYFEIELVDLDKYTSPVAAGVGRVRSGAAGSRGRIVRPGDFAKIVARNHFVNKIFISLRGISPRFDRRRLGRGG